MKCDRCGCQFPAHEAETATINEAIRSPGRMPYTRLAAMTVCPECAVGRAATIRLVYWLLAVFVGGLTVIGLVQCRVS